MYFLGGCVWVLFKKKQPNLPKLKKEYRKLARKFCNTTGKYPKMLWKSKLTDNCWKLVGKRHCRDEGQAE